VAEAANDSLTEKSWLNKKEKIWIVPKNYLELVIQGGNHAGFGNYGLQKGDGNADITSDQQQEGTAQAFAEFCSMAAKAENISPIAENLWYD
jgi:hypothetical protein